MEEIYDRLADSEKEIENLRQKVEKMQTMSKEEKGKKIMKKVWKK